MTATYEYRIHGLHCVEEVRAISQALTGREGVLELRIDLVGERLVARLDPHVFSAADLTASIAALGLRAEPWAPSQKSVRSLSGRTWFALASGFVLLGGMVVQWADTGSVLALLADHEGHQPPALATWLFRSAAVCGLVSTLPAAWRSLRAARFDMNVLVLFSIGGAAGLGEWSEGAAVASLFAIAGELESWSAARARQAVSGLIALTPPHAHVIEYGQERCVPLSEVVPGAVVLVRPGERVPVDGIVATGVSTVDQGVVTGEAIPVVRHPGDRVLAGSLNGRGAIEVRAERPASESTVSRMLQAVDEARLRRTHAELWIERFSRRYTPLVLVIALAVVLVPPLVGLGSWTEWFYRGLVVTLIACPCALVISTPVTIAAALASAARNGVLIKGGEYLERLARARVVAFDKTGVVTNGDPEVLSIEALPPHTETDVLRRLAAVESRSEHPLGRAIMNLAVLRGVPPLPSADVCAIPGLGVEGTVDGQRLWSGSLRLAHEQHATAPDVWRRAQEVERLGLSVVLCGIGSEVWAILGVRDAMNASAGDVVRRLSQGGIQLCVLLTGDHRVAAEEAGRVLGVHAVHAGLMPADKADLVRHYEQTAGDVIMVGDGMNDTAALVTASVGVAMGGCSTDVALDAAGVTCMTADLALLPWVIGHAKRTLAVVKQNVAFAVGMKLLFLLMAVTGHATLWVAVAADTGATIAVTLNGLRLLRAQGLERPRADQKHAVPSSGAQAHAAGDCCANRAAYTTGGSSATT